MDKDISVELSQAVREAHESRGALSIVGGGSKSFYGRESKGARLDVSGHSGVVHYEPSELVVTVRSGTSLSGLQAVLAENKQMLGFEPPDFAGRATVGGAVASGLAGPRRPVGGAARDHVLGVRCINGKGEMLKVGGEVVKNVAGFDVSRLMVGSMGTLGVLLDVSLRVLPMPEHEVTLAFDATADEAIDLMNVWSRTAWPVSASAWVDGRVYLRLSGFEVSVAKAMASLGGEQVQAGEEFWRQLREYRLDFFKLADEEQNLWRIAVPPATPMLKVAGEPLIEWGGAMRWLKSPLPSPFVREIAARAKGHATLFYGKDRHGMVFHPLSDGLYKLHKRVKQAFDPHEVLNPGRMYPDI